MIGQVDSFLVFTPVANGRCHSKPNPSSISIKGGCFCSFSLEQNLTVSRAVLIESSGALVTSRLSRSARTVAQDVLFDYLHSTRSFSFLDAEHISKNSPRFLQNLLSNIDSDSDVARSLRKFLRFNPINEFEPFFESIGLSPSELSSHLPRHLMYLSDDHVLLENFQVLCNYGIPRGQIGKIYKEAKEIFGYEYGLLALKLRAYENLGLGCKTVVKLVVFCPSLLTGGTASECVEVVKKLNRLGFSSDWIEEFLSGKYSFDWKRMLDTINFLERVGYEEDQLHGLLKTSPALVFEGSRKVYLLFAQLLKLGLKMDELYSLFIQNPQVLSAKCVKNLLRAVNVLLDIGMSAEETANIISTHWELLCSSPLKGPKAMCRNFQVKKDSLCQIIREDPMNLFRSASGKQSPSRKPSEKLEKTAFLLRLGYAENSDELMNALKRFRGRGDQLQQRFDCLVQAGLDFKAVTKLVKHAPMVLNQNKDVIEKKIDCLINYLGYPLESVIAFPAYLCYDIERINRRFRMYVWLRDKGAAKPTLALSTMLACSDARFVKYFIDVHPEAPAMWETIRKHKL